MKILSLLFLLILVSCNSGGGSSSGSSDDGDPRAAVDSNTCLDENNAAISCTPSDRDLLITYNSNGLYQASGVSLDLMGTFDESRVITLPEFIDALQDSDGVLVFNDRLRIIFVDTTCDWHWNGAQFEFFACSGKLNTVTSGHRFTLKSLRNSSNPEANGKIEMGVVRNPAPNYSGIIEVEANLQ